MRYTGRDVDLVSRECVSRKYDLLVGDEAARAMIYVGDQSVSVTYTSPSFLVCSGISLVEVKADAISTAKPSRDL